MAAGSLGFQIGGEAKDIIITFNNDEALKKFRDAKGWEAGIDGNVALSTVGGGEKTLVAMNKNPNYKGCPVEPVFNGMLSDFISSGERAKWLIHQRRTSG
ncbi:MAG: YSC84-related protein [Desulfobacterales bacterium]|jgi:hypothetical protein|nr:hypothetical protein [Deltaproteobacteria bacterium]